MTDQAQSHSVGEPRGSHALAESLELQRAAQERLTAGKPKHGKRRKGDVIDVDQRLVVRNRRRRIFMTLLVVEAVVAVIAVGVLVAYIWLQGDNLS